MITVVVVEASAISEAEITGVISVSSAATTFPAESNKVKWQ